VAGAEEPNVPRGQAALQPLAEVNFETGYAGLIAAFRARAAERHIAITGEAVAQVAGIPNFYLAKILSPSSKPAKRFGAASLGPILACLGLKIVLVEDSEALEKYASRIPKRQESFVHRGGTVQFVLTRRHLRAIQKKGGRNSRLYMSKRQASALARKAVKARWAKRKQNGVHITSAGEIAS
jgi:hypothetical protein